ncbi:MULTISPECIES: FAD-binding oxidoreductase [unclassified Nocardiopsis]|uniref:FAD-binding oxidoreductase n=1 Tax=Nocardiopsis TaxID=2013 RepID=UPI00387A8511
METTSNPALAPELARRVRGPVLTPGRDGYDEETAGFNLAAERRPPLVLGATGPEDVRAAVGFAAERGLRLAVHATGHGAGLPVADGLLVSTRRMDGVRVDPRTRTARIGAGTRWHRVIEAAARHGLAPLNGSSPLVGAVSYTLGGGLPVLGRTFGWAADRLRSVDIATPAHGPVTAAPDRHTDLYWALRGGGTGYGAVTAVEIGLVPLAGLYGGGLYFPGASAERVLTAWWEWTGTIPEAMNTSIALLNLPDAPGVPEPLRGRPVVHVRIAHVGRPEAGEALVAPLRALGPRLLDTVARMPVTSIAAVHDDPTEPMPYDERSLMLGPLDTGALAVLLEQAGTGLVMVELRHLGGALGRRPDPAGPFDAIAHRGASYSLATLAAVPGPGAIGWVHGPGAPGSGAPGSGVPGSGAPGPYEAAALLDRMAPWGTGRRFANFLGGPRAAFLACEAYTPDVLTRLAAVKDTYDPDHLLPAAHLTGSHL